MATYLVGDLQGCLTPLQRLLDRLHFDTSADQIWFAGDLVNRGPQSLETLRYVKALGPAARTVLGNHDLHLLAVAHGVRKPGPKDTLDKLLKAPDRDALIDWLRRQPLAIHAPEHKLLLVHAGVHPHWDLRTTLALAAEVQKKLSGNRYRAFLAVMYGNEPARWSPTLRKRDRRRFVINVLTRMRYCQANGRLDLEFSGPPARAPAKLLPWYAIPGAHALPARVAFGHWSSHPAMAPPGILPLDRGCVWGGTLAAWQLENDLTYTVACGKRAMSAD